MSQNIEIRKSAPCARNVYRSDARIGSVRVMAGKVYAFGPNGFEIARFDYDGDLQVAIDAVVANS